MYTCYRLWSMLYTSCHLTLTLTLTLTHVCQSLILTESDCHLWKQTQCSTIRSGREIMAVSLPLTLTPDTLFGFSLCTQVDMFSYCRCVLKQSFMGEPWTRGNHGERSCVKWLFKKPLGNNLSHYTCSYMKMLVQLVIESRVVKIMLEM